MLLAVVSGLALLFAASLTRARRHRTAPPAGEEGRLAAAVERSPRSPAARGALGRYYLDHGQTFEAIGELGAAHALQPAERSVSLQLAVALSSGLLQDQAISHLEALTAQQPTSRDGRVQLATLYLGTLQPAKALRVLRQAPGLDRWPDGQMALGQAYEALGQPGSAEAAYRRARALAPGSTDALSHLSRYYLRHGKVAAARAVLQAAEQQFKPTAPLLVLLAQCYPATKDAPTAERWLKAAARLDPGSVPALVALGQVYRRKGRTQEAVRSYRSALQLAPGDTTASMGLADLLQSTGQTVEAHAVRAQYFRAKGLPVRAIREYEAVARSPDQRVPAAMEMGLVLLETQQKKRAVEVTRTALSLRPNDPAIYERLVVLERLWSGGDRARHWCEEWQRLEPGSLRPVWLLGKIAADRGELDEATRLLQKAVDGEPENMEYAVTLADVLLRRPDRARQLRARELLERAAARQPMEATTHEKLGQLLIQLGEDEAARRELLRSLDLDPNVSAPYVSLVRLARQHGHPEQISLWSALARSVENRVREEQLLSRRTWLPAARPEDYRDFARFLIRNTNLRKAESQLEEALRLRPGWAEARDLLAAVRRTREVL